MPWYGFLFSGTVLDNIPSAGRPSASPHRLTTIAQADQIAVVEDGRIVEAGPPAELRARGGRFTDLFARWLAGAA